MSHRIAKVFGPAKRLGISPGDELLRLNGEIILDLIDYQALCASSKLEITWRHNGVTKSGTVKKDEYEPLGLEFDRDFMSGVRCCCNRCIFCFVDQLPCGVRSSLKVKDDDWRLSLMTGSYVTLTNVSDRELDRIIARHASPLYISVHASDAGLRSEILGTPRAGRLMDQLRRLKDGGISFHLQAVLCPGINDGAELERTISDMAELMPAALSLALVPVGLTGHRENLYPVRRYTEGEARSVIAISDRWRRKLLAENGTRFVFPSDEFYLQANMELPSDCEYEDYGQIDDGVGMLRLLDTEFSGAWDDRFCGEEVHIAVPGTVIACGSSAAGFMRSMLSAYPLDGIEVIAVENHFFGPSVTVSGLITGSDLVRALKGMDCRRVLITCCMLRDGEDVFLDDMTLEQVESELGIKLVPVGRTGEDLLSALID